MLVQKAYPPPTLKANCRQHSLSASRQRLAHRSSLSMAAHVAVNAVPLPQAKYSAGDGLAHHDA